MRALLTFGSKVESLSSLSCVVLDLKWELLQQVLRAERYVVQSLKICGIIVERNVALAELVDLVTVTAFLPPQKRIV